MAKAVRILTARSIASITELGRHADGDGLYLKVRESGSKSWIFMWKTSGKRTEIGLGPISSVTLAKAREQAQKARELVREGKDPRSILNPTSGIPSFGAVADELIADMESSWRNEKHKAQWCMTLTQYCKAIRNLPVDKIETSHVLSVLKPLWSTRPETASRLRGRIEAVIAAATAKGLRSGPNPAQWRNHLDRLLPKRTKLSRGHHSAMPYKNMPAFILRLRELTSLSALALEFTILTAARSGEVYGAQWKEFDLEAVIWTIPATRMKAGVEHRVPLSLRAIEILNILKKYKQSDFVFAGRSNKQMSNMAMSMLLRKLEPSVTVHGMRSTFRDWAGEMTNYPREIAEMALAHRVGDETERAYRRGDALEKRRELMNEWECYLSGDGNGL
jgi:integrase